MFRGLGFRVELEVEADAATETLKAEEVALNLFLWLIETYSDSKG